MLLKIIYAVKRRANGSSEKLSLGRLDISRDWGWTPEYVRAMWLMLQQDGPEDYVVATGAPIALEDFVRTAFECAGLDWRKYVVQDEKLFRPADATVSFGDPTKAFKKLGWQATIQGVDVVKKMYE